MKLLRPFFTSTANTVLTSTSFPLSYSVLSLSIWHYRGPGFLSLICFGSSPSPSPVSQLSLFLCLFMCRRSSLLTEEGGGGWGVVKSHDCEKAWSPLNYSILSGREDGPITSKKRKAWPSVRILVSVSKCSFSHGKKYQKYTYYVGSVVRINLKRTKRGDKQPFTCSTAQNLV